MLSILYSYFKKCLEGGGGNVKIFVFIIMFVGISVKR